MDVGNPADSVIVKINGSAEPFNKAEVVIVNKLGCDARRGRIGSMAFI